MPSICIDLGGTRCKLGVVQNGQVIDVDHMPSMSDMSFESIIKRLTVEIKNLINVHKIANHDTIGIGIALPGIINSKNNRVIAINGKFVDAINFDFNNWARNEFNLPIIIENDARAALCGSWKYGVGRSYSNLCIMTLGTGVGTAALIENKILRGKHFTAGNLGGHFIIDKNGFECNCGNKGCVEAMASSWQLPNLVRSNSKYQQSSLHEIEVINFKTVFDHFRRGDELAIEAISHCLDSWSAGIVNLIHAYDPEAVVLTGGLMKSSDIIIPYLQDVINRRAWTPIEKVKLLKEPLEEKAALLGMHSLLVEKRKIDDQ